MVVAAIVPGRADKECRKRWMVPTGSRGQRLESTSFMSGGKRIRSGNSTTEVQKEQTREFRRVIIRRKLEVPYAFPVRRRDHPNDEDKKRGMEQSRLREVKNRRLGLREGDLKRKGRRRRRGTNGWITRGEHEDDDTDEGDGFDDFPEEVCDDRTGEVLDAKDECWARTGGAPMSTKWVRVNQGTSSNPIVRARLVARDFKTKGKESMFAGMPPLEAKELLFRMCAKEPFVFREGKWQRRKWMFLDVKKAHLNGKVQEGEYAFVSLLDVKFWQLKCERFMRFCVPTNTHMHTFVMRLRRKAMVHVHELCHNIWMTQ